MKHSITSSPFKPVDITITCETQNELDALYAIFNHVRISSAAGKVFGIQEADLELSAKLRQAGARYLQFGEYAEELKRQINS